VEQSFAPKWTPRCAQAFEQLKQALVSAPVLALPDFSRSFTVVCDACTAAPAVGGVLLQDRHPVAFYSKKLSPFLIETDHQPNTYVDQSTNQHTLKRRARWLYESSAYNYVWKYRPGETNVADPETVESVQPIVQTIKGYLVDDLLGRCRQGCVEMQRTDQKRFDKLQLIRHQDGLYWTSDDRLYIPRVGTL